MIQNSSKKLFIFLSFVFIVNSSLSAQDKTVDIDIDKNQKAVKYTINDQGNSALVVWDKKNKSSRILNYGSDLELKYDESFASKFIDNSGFSGGAIRPVYYYDMVLSKSGDYIYAGTDDLIFNSQGEYKKYLLESEDESKNIETYFGFLSDKYGAIVGGDKEKVKKNWVYKDFFLLRKGNKDITNKKINLPNLHHGKKGWFSLGLVDAFEDKFYMVSKDYDKEKLENNYHLTSYNYEGEKQSEVFIPVALENKFFMASNNGGGVGYVKRQTWYNAAGLKDISSSTKHELDYNSISNIYMDKDNSVVYIFGLYTDKKEKDSYNASYGGYYIHKYTLDGKEEWKLQKPIVDKSDFNKAAVAFFMEVNIMKLNDNKLGFTIHKSNTKQFAHFFTINALNGEVEKNKKIKYKVSKIRLQGMKQGHAFPTGFNSKDDFGKLHLDLNCLYASYLSDNVKTYLSSKKDTDLAFNCKITEQGIYLIQENVKENKYKLMKFNW